MYQFILQAILFGSAGTMAFLFARAMPRVVPAEDPETVWDRLSGWFGRLPLHRLDDRLNSFLFKFLKRLRVVIMKADNRIIRHLDAVKRTAERHGSGHVQEMLDHVQGTEDEKTPE